MRMLRAVFLFLVMSFSVQLVSAATINYETVTDNSLIGIPPQLGLIWPPRSGITPAPGFNPSGSTSFFFNTFPVPFINFFTTDMEIETGLPGQAMFTQIQTTFVNGRTESLSSSGDNFISYSDPFNFTYAASINYTQPGVGTTDPDITGTIAGTGFGYTLYNTPGLDDSSVFAGISFPGVGPFSVQDQFDYLLTIVDPNWTALTLAIADQQFPNETISYGVLYTVDEEIFSTIVPIPSAFFLFLPGLFGLMMFRRSS